MRSTRYSFFFCNTRTGHRPHSLSPFHSKFRLSVTQTDQHPSLHLVHCANVVEFASPSPSLPHRARRCCQHPRLRAVGWGFGHNQGRRGLWAADSQSRPRRRWASGSDRVSWTRYRSRIIVVRSEQWVLTVKARLGRHHLVREKVIRGAIVAVRRRGQHACGVCECLGSVYMGRSWACV